MKPKVILDLAFLGHARRVQRGAERVARHLFDGLVGADFAELRFVATSHHAGVHDFLQSRGIDPRSAFSCSPTRLRLSRLERAVTTKVHNSLGNRALPARAMRYVLSKLALFFQHGEADLDPVWLDTAQIYHSPHTPFPESIHGHPRLRKFLTCHDFIPMRHPEFYPPNAGDFMDAVRRCLRPENFAFCVSEVTRADVLNYSSMPPEHVFVTPLAADRRIFHPVVDPAAVQGILGRYGLGQAPYFLALSAHDPHKNFPHLIECFGALLETGELGEHRLVIVGPNPGHNPAVQLALKAFSKVERRLIVPGFVPDEDLAAIYSGATAFLFPSFAEGFGIPPLEAMQCGTPVIASNTTSMPEVIGDAGVLLPPNDRDGWCQAMLRMSQDASLRAEFRERALTRAALFSWDRFIAETIRGYRFSLEHS